MVLPSPLLLGYSHQKTGIHLISQIIFDQVDDACWDLLRCLWKKSLWHSFHSTSNSNKQVPEESDSPSKDPWTTMWLLLYKFIILLSL